MMRILWISSLAWKENGEYDFPVAGSGAVSGSLFQQAMIEGLEELGAKVDIISDYPYRKRANRKGKVFHHCEDSNDIIIPNCKSAFLLRLLKTLWLRKALKKQIRQNRYDAVVSYLVHTPYMICLKTAHKLGLKTAIICPDLSDMMDLSLNEKPLKRILKKVDKRYQTRLFDFVDGYVLFSKYMAEKLPINGRPVCVIEGVASVDDLDLSPAKKQKAFMYAGSLQKNFGIENIIESMNYIKSPDIELWIFGDGALSNWIKDKEEKDKRIKYFGFVDRAKLFEYEKSAAVLINARDTKSEFTRYSFPSKTFEYLYSGTYFLSTKLSGIPDEYFSYIKELDDNNPKTIAGAVERLFSQEYEADYSDNVRSFVKTKDKSHMASRLLDFLDKFV